MADIGWARSRGDRAEGQGLRRGAWYRVVETPPKEYVVLDVHHVGLQAPQSRELDVVRSRSRRPERVDIGVTLGEAHRMNDLAVAEHRGNLRLQGLGRVLHRADQG